MLTIPVKNEQSLIACISLSSQILKVSSASKYTSYKFSTNKYFFEVDLSVDDNGSSVVPWKDSCIGGASFCFCSCCVHLAI